MTRFEFAYSAILIPYSPLSLILHIPLPVKIPRQGEVDAIFDKLPVKRIVPEGLHFGLDAEDIRFSIQGEPLVFFVAQVVQWHFLYMLFHFLRD